MYISYGLYALALPSAMGLTNAATLTSQASLPTVTLAGGFVVGTTTSLTSATATVNQYLGVPFAAPPQRFALPSKVVPWTTPLNASVRSSACIQQVFTKSAAFTNLFFNNPIPPQSEDCLYLNVFTPSTTPPAGGFAVLYWIFGGSLRLGNGGQPLYDGSFFAAFEDVIIVAPNYRTNVFGFPSSPEIPLTQRNLGFYDQRFALQWVQDNIGAFGGNPAKVTIFGESAGATSVDTLVTSWPHNPPFRAAILESGQNTVINLMNVGVNSTDSWVQLAAALNCSTAISPLACVSGANATVIQSILNDGALQFRPVVDEVTFISNPSAARLNHNIANVSVMLGSNGQEGRVLIAATSNLTTFLPTIPGMTTDLEAAITAAYPLGAFASGNQFDIAAQPIGIVVNASAAAGYPAWRYWYNATFPNEQLKAGVGAYHFSEIAQVFSTYNTYGAPTAQQIALSTFMRGAWAAFAKDPETGPGWNPIGSPGDMDLGVLGSNGSTGVQILTQDLVDVNCALYTQLYTKASGTPF